MDEMEDFEPAPAAPEEVPAGAMADDEDNMTDEPALAKTQSRSRSVAPENENGDIEDNSGGMDEFSGLEGVGDDDMAKAYGITDAKRLNEEAKKVPTKADIRPIMRFVDIPENTKPDIVDTVVKSIENFGGDPEAAAKNIKELLDRKYGPHWHAIVGEAFGYEVTYHLKHILYIFIDNLGILVWKCC